MQVESRIGAIFISLFALFMAGFIFIAIKNYDIDQIVLGATSTEVKSMSSTERQLMANWIKDNNIIIPEGQGYRYLIKEYPTRPWLSY